MKGEGTIVSKGRGKWQVQVDFGTNPVTGKRDRVSRTVNGTKDDARRALAEITASRDSGISADSSRVTFGEFAGRWQEAREKSPALARRSKSDSAYCLGMVLPWLGTVKIADIGPHAVSETLSAIEGERDVSSGTLRKVYGYIKQIMSLAVDYELISRNPCDKVRPPRRNEIERRSLSAFDIRRLARALEADAEAELEKLGSQGASAGPVAMSRIAAVRIGLASGMRVGEVLALQWRDFDEAAGIVTVRHALDSDMTLKSPKSRAGHREIALDAGTVSFLSRWKAVQAAAMDDMGVRQAPDSPVCCSNSLGYINQSNFGRWWSEWRERHGFHGLKFHELRHTQATQLIGNGADIKTVQSRLGHSSVSLTLDMYAHPVTENDRRAASLFGDMMGCPAPAPEDRADGGGEMIA